MSKQNPEKPDWKVINRVAADSIAAAKLILDAVNTAPKKLVYPLEEKPAKNPKHSH